MSNNRPLQLVQITDPHLHASLDGTLLGLTTQYSLDLVLQKIRKERPALDAVLATGDIAQDGSVEAYRRFRSILEDFTCPSRWCPGNHDINENMLEAANGAKLGELTLELDNWLVVLLDSSVANKVYGQFAEAEFEKLEQTLSNHSDKHCLVTFHHHPIDMGSRWIDQQRIKNGDRMVELIHRFDNVRAVLWGHVHQELDKMIDGVRYLSTPSTCVQFEPQSTDFSVDKEQPGYRWFELHSDGSFDTGVSRVQDVEFEIDYTVKGY